MTASILALQKSLRLRRNILQATQRELIACINIEDESARAERAAEDDIVAEQEAASSLHAPDVAVEAFAAWLPSGRATLARARRAHGDAASKTMEARSNVLQASIAVESLEKLLKNRVEAERREAERRLAAMLEDSNKNLCRT